MKKNFLLAVLFLSLLMIGCIDYKEKLKLNFDGSGEINFAVGINTELFYLGDGENDFSDFNEKKIKQNYENKDGIHFINSKSYSKDGIKWIEITLHFESVEKLMEASKDSNNVGMIGQIELKKNDNGDCVYTRNISGSNSAKKAEKDFSNNMMELMFSKYKWDYELTLPAKIISTNAADSNISEDSHTVKWSYTMASLAQGNKMKVTYKNERSVDYAYIIIGALLMIVLSYHYIKSVKKTALKKKQSD